MSITVVSTTHPEAQAVAPAAASTEGQAQETSSAPAAESAAEQNESEASETTETEGEGESGEEGAEASATPAEPEKDKKKKGGFQRRIDKLNSKLSAKDQEIEHWKTMAFKNAGAPKNDKVEPTPATPAASDGKPLPENFESHKEYIEKLTEWTTEQKLKERDQRDERSKLEREQGDALKAHYARETAFMAKTPDYSEAMEEVGLFKDATPALRELIVSSDLGPELMYELAKNPDEYARICKLSPLAAAREMGKIETKLSAKTSDGNPQPKKTTNAPKPIEPVGARAVSGGKSPYDAANMSQREYERIRAKQRSAS